MLKCPSRVLLLVGALLVRTSISEVLRRDVLVLGRNKKTATSTSARGAAGGVAGRRVSGTVAVRQKQSAPAIGITSAAPKPKAKVKAQAKQAVAGAAVKAKAKVKAEAKIKAKAKEKVGAKVKAKAKVKAEAKIKAKAKEKVGAKVKAKAKVKAEAKIKAKAKLKAAAKMKAKAERKAGAKGKATGKGNAGVAAKAKAVSRATSKRGATAGSASTATTSAVDLALLDDVATPYERKSGIIMSLKVPKLRELCRKYGLSPHGKKAVLRDRLAEYFIVRPGTSAAAAAAPSSTTEARASSPPQDSEKARAARRLMRKKKFDLQLLCDAKDLSTSGTKKEMTERLLAADAEVRKTEIRKENKASPPEKTECPLCLSSDQWPEKFRKVCKNAKCSISICDTCFDKWDTQQSKCGRKAKCPFCRQELAQGEPVRPKPDKQGTESAAPSTNLLVVRAGSPATSSTGGAGERGRARGGNDGTTILRPAIANVDYRDREEYYRYSDGMHSVMSWLREGRPSIVTENETYVGGHFWDLAEKLPLEERRYWMRRYDTEPHPRDPQIIKRRLLEVEKELKQQREQWERDNNVDGLRDIRTVLDDFMTVTQNLPWHVREPYLARHGLVLSASRLTELMLAAARLDADERRDWGGRAREMLFYPDWGGRRPHFDRGFAARLHARLAHLDRQSRRRSDGTSSTPLAVPVPYLRD